MATIDPFIYNGPTTSVLDKPLPTPNPQDASAVQTDSAAGFAQVGAQLGQRAEMIGQSARGAQMLYENADMRAQLHTDAFNRYVENPEIMAAIASKADMPTVYMMKMDEAKRLEQIPKIERSYIDSSSIGFQEDYLRFRNQSMQGAAPDGSGYTQSINKYFNDASLSYVQNAPTDNAKAIMLDRIQNMKTKAIGEALTFEDKRRDDWDTQQLTSAGTSLATQAALAPENYPAYMQQSANLKQTMLDNGIEPSKVEAWSQKQNDQVSSAYIHGLIMRDPTTALSQLANSDVNQNLLAPSYITLAGEATKAIKENQKTAADQLELGHAYNRIASNIPLNENNPMDKKAADSYYNQQTAQLRDQDTGALNQDPKTTASTLYSVVSSIKGVVPENFKSDFQNAMYYGGPGNTDQAETMARLVGQMQTDPNTAPILNKLDPKALKMAIYVNASLNAGGNVGDALEQAKKQILLPQQGDDSIRKQEVDKQLTTANIESSLKGYFSSWFAPLTGGSFHDPVNLDLAVKEYDRAYRDAYMGGSDAATADSYAKTTLSKTFGVSNVNGTPQIMAYAPSVVFPNREKDFNANLVKTLGDSYGFQTSKALPVPASYALYAGENPPDAVVGPDRVDTSKIMLDGNPVQWSIKSTDTHGTNYAQKNGQYPVYYTDNQGLQKPLLGKDGIQMAFTYQPGLTPEEADAMSDSQKRQQAINYRFAQHQSQLGEIADLVMKSPNVDKMTPEQKYLLTKQLEPISVGK